ncbi:hypothetical protein LTR91_011443 [Friedmanniomyces endolithicus]|uniref:Uncharacterized protein n=1 Tax=Friedmanniomyces endolithicus TaxID=329885 RepID=A0A4U0UJ58_9PEZI|nr:hypothetical protein LTS09_009970 [Friedmanniomyces endolithicus]KAK0264089.1 hypothetical protein LTR35_017395 [Friedmanniomyces endolithicus]KAK0270596.1 hypothetical protein LTS00_016921 [Friedmanniomyces endolithicus]KAK0303721.1 hypothetical protein LTR01_007807 [Friedmanniomyces endolithicus]KAK0313962.1 hypothetical protein LTR82_013272 [Friedmanniomyces endolithicus]
MAAANGADPFAGVYAMIDRKVEEQIKAVRESLHQQDSERTEALRKAIHQENSEWKEAAFEQLKLSIASYAKEGKQAKELRLEITEAKQEKDLLKNGMAAVAEDRKALAIRMQSLEQKLQAATAVVITTDDGRQFAVTPLVGGCLSDFTRRQEHQETNLPHVAQQALSLTSSLSHPTLAEMFKEPPSLGATTDGEPHAAMRGQGQKYQSQELAPSFLSQPGNGESECESLINIATSTTLGPESDPISSLPSDHLAEANGRSSSDSECIPVAPFRRTNPAVSRAHSEHLEVPNLDHRHDLLSDLQMVRKGSQEDTGTADGALGGAARRQPPGRSSSLPLKAQSPSDLLKQFEPRPDRVAKQNRAAEDSALLPVEEVESAVAFGKGPRRRAGTRPLRYQENDSSTVKLAGRKGRAGSIKRKFPDDEFMMLEEVQEEDEEAVEARQQKLNKARDARASRRM